ncbi:hypothetical protein B4900_03290 [Yersinia rohdei]|nr:hypothetical protein B4900_03290 [Yersinia rohdei]
MRLINISSEGSRCISKIKEEYVKLLATYNDLALELLKPEYSIGDDMQITPHVNFNLNLFERFISLFDMRGNLNNLLSPLYNKNNELEFNLNTHTASIFDILDNTKNKNCPAIKSSTSRKDIIQNLFSDYFNLEYEVKYKGDEIIQMSPGKRGLVLLNLLLHLSNASHPILIDQPEDNLDNRTIYDQLNNFIRERKKSRQIILVTHNANLVVSADSECVIVANQSGQGKNMENEKYRFEYIYGGLENSFEKQNERFLLKAKGIRQHVCEILEGGKEAFREREIKYGLRH